MVECPISGRADGAQRQGALAGETVDSGQRARALVRNLLEKRGRDGRFMPWFPTAIDAPGANPFELRFAGFDVLVDGVNGDPERFKPRLDNGVMLMKRLSGAITTEGPRRLVDQITNYPLRQSVAFWHLGERLGRQREIKSRESELAKFRESLAAIRGLDDEVSALATANVEGELPLYARVPSGLDSIGIQPRMWGSCQNLLESYEYLAQRKLLTARSNLGVFFWAWLPAMTPPSVVRNIWGDNTPPSWGIPTVQPEQLRLMTYLALSAGYRGLGFVGDSQLTRTDGLGRALLIEMTFLNLEIDLCEQILAENDEAIPLYPVFDPDPLPVPSNAVQLPSKRPPRKPELAPRGELKAAAVALRDRKGSLLIVGDYHVAAQYQPGQMAADQLKITPILPEGAQAFEITPGEVKVLTPERVPGGRRITLEEFDTTSLILCTADLGLYENVRRNVDAVRSRAVPLAIEQAEIMLKAVTETNGRLAADGHQFLSKVDLKLRKRAGIESPPPDVPDILVRAKLNIESARKAAEKLDYALAWAEARRAKRALRVVMNGHWNQAWLAFARAAESINPEGAKPEDEDPKRVEKIPKVKLDAPLLIQPISCPPCISFFTLPEHYIWVDWIKGRPGYRFGPNRVPSGSFEDPIAMTAEGWVDVSYQAEGFKSDNMKLVSRNEANGKEIAKNRPNRDQLSPDNAHSNRVVMLQVEAENPEEIDTILPKFFDFPVAAIRSPPIPVEANNLIRISVLVKRPYASAGGLGGVICAIRSAGNNFSSGRTRRFHRSPALFFSAKPPRPVPSP